MEKVFDLTKFIAVIWKWKIHLIAVFVASAVISAIASSPMFIKPKYKSTVIVYPTNVKTYGTETAVEQMLQMLEANDIRDSIISKYHLLAHYGIDSSENPYYHNDVQLEYGENILFSKTKYESVEIEVMDYSSDTAYLMAKDIINLYNHKINTIQKKSLKEVESTIKAQLVNKKKEMDDLDSIVKGIRIKYGILDYENQVRYMSRNGDLRDEDLVGSMGVNSKSPSLIRNLKEHGGQFIAAQNQLDQARGAYNYLKNDYENVTKELKRQLDYTQVVVSPEKADKKSYPIRWLIVVISILSSMTLAFVMISIYEQNLDSK
ncbi:MAG: Wzz/FepE/Etk N-terminal domain-containing protein [Flavobacteriales bacterium]